MKKPAKHRLLTGLLLFIAFFSLLPSRTYAVSGSIYFVNSGGSSVRVGDSFTTRVTAKVGKPLWSGGATIGVTYPTNLLQVTGTSSTGGALGDATATVSGGTVNFTVFDFWGNAVNDEMIFTITFKALAAGSATLDFTSGTNVNDGPTTKTASTYTVLAATCPAGQTGTPPNCVTLSASPTPSATPKPTTAPKPTTTPAVVAPVEPTPEETIAPVASSDGGLKIENVKAEATRKQNTVSWTTSSGTVAMKFLYGTAKGTQKTEATAVKNEDGTYSVALPDLKLGTLYYFTIKASTPDELQGATYNGTFTTKGYPVQLLVQQNGILAPNAKVKIGDRSFTANKDGIVATELGDGTYEALITLAGASSTHSVKFSVAKKAIPANGDPTTQQFTLNAIAAGASSAEADTSEQTTMTMIIGGVVAAVLGLAGVVGFFLYRKRRQQTDTAVDGDLLAASYGPALQDHRAQTPVPNLDVRSAGAAVLPLPPALEQPLPAEQPLAEPSPTYTPEEPPLANTQPAYVASTQETPAPSYEQALAPAPPTAAADPQPAQPHDEGGSNKAVYHPETGELEILHRPHHQAIGGAQ